MAFRKFLGLTMLLVSSFLARAEEIQINPAHPDQYTVVSGDTLWDISGKFLQHPWQWPELWRTNTQIQNPHLIYPGDTIYFSVVNGQPQLSLNRDGQVPDAAINGLCVLNEQDYKNGRSDFAVDKNGKVLPCIRVSDFRKSIDLIPSQTIAKYLSSPKVLSENELNLQPYIIDMAGEHLVAGAGDRVYVRAITQPNSMAYTVFRAGDVYKSADTGEILGYEAKYIADISMVKAGDPATLAIDKSSGEIRSGDRVMTNAEEDVALSYFPRPPAKPVKGSIISVLNGVTQIGQYDVVVLDKGAKDGLLVGHELDIFNRGRIARDAYSQIKNDAVQLPDEHAGKLMVFRTFQRVSYALVLKASHAIHVLDKVQSP